MIRPYGKAFGPICGRVVEPKEASTDESREACATPLI
jgi:hypothetical protein